MNITRLNYGTLKDAVVIKGAGSGGGVQINNQSKSVEITENGRTSVTHDADYTGLSKVDISVNVPPKNQEKAIEITENGTTEVTADSGFTGLGKVIVTTNIESGGGEDEYPIFRDGRTHYHIELVSSLNVYMYFNNTTTAEVSVDWGDGYTQTETFSGAKGFSHTYSKYGKYIISHNGERLGAGGAVVVSEHCLKAVEIGAIEYLYEYGFKDCCYLEKVVFTSAAKMSTIYNSTFANDYALKTVIFEPRTSKLYLETRVFENCYTLEEIDLTPLEITLSKDYIFQNCSSLRRVKLLDCSGWSSIRTNVFSYCKNLTILDLSLCSSVISLSNGALDGKTYLKIIVPDSLYDTWIAATNWSAHASKIVKASEFNA